MVQRWYDCDIYGERLEFSGAVKETLMVGKVMVLKDIIAEVAV